MQAAVVGISYYVVKKFGDEFWDVVCKPRVRKIFEGVDKVLTGGNVTGHLKTKPHNPGGHPMYPWVL
jgi:hypothetical protein